MKRLVVTYCSFLFLLCSETSKAQSSIKSIETEFSTGWQQQNFNWSIAGNLQGINPNILSELKWKYLKGPKASINIKWNAFKKFYLNAGLSGSLIVDGKATDTDYQDDNRMNPSFQAFLQSNKGHDLDIITGIGYKIEKKKFYLLPSAGYGIHKQLFYLNEKENPDPNRILNSSYQADWKGPYFNLTSGYISNSSSEFKVGATYHQAKYQAKANWNLADDFAHPVSFRHDAKGFGIEGNIQFKKLLKPGFNLLISSGYFYWSTGRGIDELYKSDGQVVRTRLNDVTRKGWSIELGISKAL